MCLHFLPIHPRVFLSSGTADILGRILLSCGGCPSNCTLYCRGFSIHKLMEHPLDAGTNPFGGNQKLPNILGGKNHPQLRQLSQSKS